MEIPGQISAEIDTIGSFRSSCDESPVLQASNEITGLPRPLMTAITIIVVLAMRDCGGWLKRARPARRADPGIYDLHRAPAESLGRVIDIGGHEPRADADV